MRRTVSTMALALIAAAGVAAVATSCGSDSTAPKNKLYVANLIAANEGSLRTSPGSGVATFIDLGTEIDWTLELTNITAMTVSHIHLGSAAAIAPNPGPVIFNLFFPNAAPGALNGEVAHGSINNKNNANISLDSLRVLFNNGNAYVNVHTSANPGGEIRDQVRPVN